MEDLELFFQTQIVLIFYCSANTRLRVLPLLPTHTREDASTRLREKCDIAYCGESGNQDGVIALVGMIRKSINVNFFVFWGRGGYAIPTKKSVQ